MTGDFPGLILGITNNYFSHVQPVYAVGHGTFSIGVFKEPDNNEKLLMNINYPRAV